MHVVSKIKEAYLLLGLLLASKGYQSSVFSLIATGMLLCLPTYVTSRHRTCCAGL